jgi:hypothetical protein
MVSTVSFVKPKTDQISRRNSRAVGKLGILPGRALGTRAYSSRDVHRGYV